MNFFQYIYRSLSARQQIRTIPNPSSEPMLYETNNKLKPFVLIRISISVSPHISTMHRNYRAELCAHRVPFSTIFAINVWSIFSPSRSI